VREDNGDVAVAFGANHAIELAEFTAEDVSVEEQEGVKGLVLGGSGHAMPYRELRKKAPYLIGAELLGGSATNKSLKLPHPKAVGSKGFPGVVPRLDTSFQRNGPRLVGERGASPYLWQKSR
jgi:hypothetical protein